jgi:hypothetical protein
MRRRTLLSSLAAGLAGVAGCSQSVPTDTTSARQPTTQTTASATTTDPGNGDPPTGDPPEGYASVVELGTGPRTYAFAPTRFRTSDDASVALWFTQTATADHPAVLRGYLENANDYENTFEVEWIPAVGNVHSRQPSGYDHEAGLSLAPTEDNALAETVPALRRHESGYWQTTDTGPWVTETRRLDPGERVELAYAVVGDPEMTERPTGTYEFRGRDETVRIAVWDTDTPGPEGESRFAGRDLTDFEGDQTTAWFHDADATTAVFARPSTERLNLDGRLTVTAVNHGHETARCGHWNFYKLVDGEWFHVAPRIHTADCRALVPGERIEWTLRAFNGEAVPCDGDNPGLTRGYLGGGEYAVVAGYGNPADQSAALVELVGDPVEVVLTEDATVERNGDEVTVTTERWNDGESPANATVTLTRTDSASERLIAEQVMGPPVFGDGHALRNALAPMGGNVSRVIVRTDADAADTAIRGDDGTRRFRFRGTAYQLTASRE